MDEKDKEQTLDFSYPIPGRLLLSGQKNHLVTARATIIIRKDGTVRTIYYNLRGPENKPPFISKKDRDEFIQYVLRDVRDKAEWVAEVIDPSIPGGWSCAHVIEVRKEELSKYESGSIDDLFADAIKNPLC